MTLLTGKYQWIPGPLAVQRSDDYCIAQIDDCRTAWIGGFEVIGDEPRVATGQVSGNRN